MNKDEFTFSVELESEISESDLVKIQNMIQLAFDTGVKAGKIERNTNVK